MDQTQGMDDGQPRERDDSDTPSMAADMNGHSGTDAAPAQTQMVDVAAQAPARREAASRGDATSESPSNRREAETASAPASATATAPAQEAVRTMPKAEPFVLPVTDLNQLADQSGLIWVHSDATKVAQVQSLIAAEPRAVHVPRERPAPTQLDEGPLVLVETRRDLADMRLPFEQEAANV